MSIDELAVMDGGKCILPLSGVRSFLLDKYDITKHSNYKFLSDENSRNPFTMETFLSARLKLKGNDVCEVYDMGEIKEDEIA